MPYSFELVPDKDCFEHVFINDSAKVDKNKVDNSTGTESYEILDEQGDSLAVVHSLAEAEILVSHLNR